MIKFFRKIRHNMIKDNKVSKYILYAIGEIILVVIGILIALSINNNNEQRKQRAQEVHYLKNIKVDLGMNIKQIDEYIETRTSAIQSANTILEHYEGKPLIDLEAFSGHAITVYTWRKFFQANNTFQELVNSGNLALISNDSIKSILLNMETQYKVMKDEEAHFRYDAETLLYEPSFNMIDMNPSVQAYAYNRTNGASGKKMPLPRNQYENMLKDVKQKNGFVMAVYEFTTMNGQLNEMKAMCNQLIELIDNEINSD